MKYVDLVVHLDDGKESATRLDVAVEIARQQGAHLTGVFVSDRPVEIELFGSGGATETATAELGAEVRAKTAFNQRIEREGISGQWTAASGKPGALMASFARRADLAVIGQPTGSNDRARRAILTETLLNSGRPVLVVPYAGKFSQVGANVLVAWDGSATVARAVADALPLLRNAAKVDILAVNSVAEPDDESAVLASDMALHLARHGVTATSSQLVVTEIPVADALLNRAFDMGIDLLVAGAYGHSAAQERVFGGVTRDLLEHMTVPVLMSH